MWFTWHDWITEVLFVPAGFMLVEKALVSVNVSYRVCTNVMSNCAFQGLKAVQEFFPWTLIIYLCAFFWFGWNWNVWNSSPLAQYNRCTLYSWQLTLRLQDRKPITETLANCIHWLPSSIQWILKAKKQNVCQQEDGKIKSSCSWSCGICGVQCSKCKFLLML